MKLLVNSLFFKKPVQFDNRICGGTRHGFESNQANEFLHFYNGVSNDQSYISHYFNVKTSPRNGTSTRERERETERERKREREIEK